MFSENATISIGVSVKRSGGISVLLDDQIVFCAPVKFEITEIRRSAERLFSSIRAFGSQGTLEQIYACVDGNTDFERQIGVWQGVLAEHGASVIPVDTRSWYHAVVSPYMESLDCKNNAIEVVIHVAQLLAPECEKIFSLQGFAESFHLARYSRMVSRELMRVQLMRKFNNEQCH